ncbi:WecB/TagA/CpsF family glycosyltransferase [Oceanobacillus senegalensis]|uniref:WecB/TagA/CpsF family glycosyltransferase n=1 Tax=Oceanobacillus senegalensis TaxID=1936063 RepID=UPI000A312F47|nr:WecB/TagA/CpsF family glycosyltransferase [Oceanobacillus senegalensis]
MANQSFSENLVTIMGIDFINVTKEDLLQHYLYPRLKREEKSFIVTANPEMVMRSKEDASFKEIMRTADFTVPDGAGVVIASKFVKDPIVERIPGFELMLDLLEHAEREGLSCYFIGAKEDVIGKTIQEVKRRHSKLKIAGYHHGYFSLQDEEVLQNVVDAQPDLIFVALGSPRQEMWISQNIDSFTKGLFIGVGGSFDVLAGEVKRAPHTWIKYNLEWLYRILKQPFRLKRFWKSIKFMLRMFIWKG